MDGDGRCGATAMGEKWCDGDLMTIDDEERCKRDGDVDTAGGGSNKGQRVITL